MIRFALLTVSVFSLSAQGPPSAPNITDSVTAARVTQVLDNAKLAGTVLIAKGDNIVYERAFGSVDPDGRRQHRLGQVWRYASVTKQWAATLAMQEVGSGRLNLDAPIITYLPASKAPFSDKITVRMLMQHVSGLPRTEESPLGVDEWPQFYLLPNGSEGTGMSYCEGPTDRAPIAEFRYGDCDFIVLGAVLENITGKAFKTLIAERFAKPLGLKSVGLFPRSSATVVGYEGGKRESQSFLLENFGAAGALYGTTHDLLRFDRALMTGKLLPDAQRNVMWFGDPKLGYAAFGQWAFSVPVKGCGATPLRFIERRGAIGGVVLRNIILPDLDVVIIMTSNRAEADAGFGEIWQQRGISHDVISSALCAPPAL